VFPEDWALVAGVADSSVWVEDRPEFFFGVMSPALARADGL